MSSTRNSKRIAAIALISIFSELAASPVRAGETMAAEAHKQQRNPAAEQLAKIDRLMETYRLKLAETERYLDRGPTVAVSTMAPLIEKARITVSAQEEMVARDEEALSAFKNSSSTGAHLQAVSACGRDFSIDNLKASYGKGWSEDDVNLQDPDKFFGGLGLYLACQDVVAGRFEQSCGVSGPAFSAVRKVQGKPDSTPKTECQAAMLQVRNMRVFAQAPEEAMKTCMNWFAHPDPAAENWLPASKAAEACAILTHVTNSKVAASKLGALMTQAPTAEQTTRLAKDMERNMGTMSAKDCVAQHSDPVEREGCLASNAWRKARSGGGAAACGGNGLCLALMGSGASSCDLYFQQVKALFCKRDYRSDKEFQDRGTKRGLIFVKLARDKDELSKQKVHLTALLASNSPETARAAYTTDSMDRLKELRAMLDLLFQSVNSVEPKSEPGLEDRRAALSDLQDSFEHLKGRAARSSKAPRKPAKK